MTGEPIITVVGNLTDDPELRFTPSGAAVANFTVASTPRTFNKQTNEWDDGETMFLRCAIWREAAENVAESLTKGLRVVATGRLKCRSYETREGEKRTAWELDVDDIGPSLKFATARVQRTQRSGNQQQGQQQGQSQGGQQQQGQQQQGQQQQGQQQQGQQQQGQQQQDPWANQQNPPDEPPF